MNDPHAAAQRGRQATRAKADHGDVRRFVSVGQDREENRVQTDEGQLYLRATVDLDHSMAPWVPVATVVGGAVHQAVRLEGPGDKRQPSGLAAAQRLLQEWYPHRFDPSEVKVDSECEQRGGEGIGAFFSGGVDSWYTVIRHPEITHLIYVEGFDVPLADMRLRERTRSHIRRVATELGKPLIEVETNLRDLLDRYTLWAQESHGAALACVAIGLAPHFDRVLIPSTYPTTALRPWGSHPDLDVLWSTSGLRLVHDGVEAGRAAKVAALKDHQLALDHLRVCWVNTDSAYNCGRCEKCLRTMTNLYANGLLERCVTLPHRIDPALVAGLPLVEHFQRHSARANLRLLHDRRPRDRALERAWRVAIARGILVEQVLEARRVASSLTPGPVKASLRRRADAR